MGGASRRSSAFRKTEGRRATSRWRDTACAKRTASQPNIGKFSETVRERWGWRKRGRIARWLPANACSRSLHPPRATATFGHGHNIIAAVFHNRTLRRRLLVAPIAVLAWSAAMVWHGASSDFSNAKPAPPALKLVKTTAVEPTRNADMRHSARGNDDDVGILCRLRSRQSRASCRIAGTPFPNVVDDWPHLPALKAEALSFVL